MTVKMVIFLTGRVVVVTIRYAFFLLKKISMPSDDQALESIVQFRKNLMKSGAFHLGTLRVQQIVMLYLNNNGRMMDAYFKEEFNFIKESKDIFFPHKLILLAALCTSKKVDVSLLKKSISEVAIFIKKENYCSDMTLYALHFWHSQPLGIEDSYGWSWTRSVKYPFVFSEEVLDHIASVIPKSVPNGAGCCVVM